LKLFQFGCQMWSMCKDSQFSMCPQNWHCDILFIQEIFLRKCMLHFWRCSHNYIFQYLLKQRLVVVGVAPFCRSWLTDSMYNSIFMLLIQVSIYNLKNMSFEDHKNTSFIITPALDRRFPIFKTRCIMSTILFNISFI